MPELYEVVQAIRYLYLDSVVPVKNLVTSDNRDPYKVRNLFGAVAFDFVRIVFFEVDQGERLRHLIAEPETYYWGEEMSIDEIEQAKGLEDFRLGTNSERFVYTAWGAFIPLHANEIVVPYPELEELPLNMRMDDSN